MRASGGAECAGERESEVSVRDMRVRVSARRVASLRRALSVCATCVRAVWVGAAGLPLTRYPPSDRALGVAHLERRGLVFAARRRRRAIAACVVGRTSACVGRSGGVAPDAMPALWLLLTAACRAALRAVASRAASTVGRRRRRRQSSAKSRHAQWLRRAGRSALCRCPSVSVGVRASRLATLLMLRFSRRCYRTRSRAAGPWRGRAVREAAGQASQSLDLPVFLAALPPASRGSGLPALRLAGCSLGGGDARSLGLARGS